MIWYSSKNGKNVKIGSYEISKDGLGTRGFVPLLDKEVVKGILIRKFVPDLPVIKTASPAIDPKEKERLIKEGKIRRIGLGDDSTTEEVVKGSPPPGFTNGAANVEKIPVDLDKLPKGIFDAFK